MKAILSFLTVLFALSMAATKVATAQQAASQRTRFPPRT